ncbi:uncharacterized protein K02A2.6-like [Eupeodes corollae]|uniref:uncharacterized protein K02A2.6-like n=1 Tax=Eupeodes corollae TaxID=290404 RepID=UPI002492E1D9|nr:uncharacterized protein K02A2.6-like [Eupeodes corollae]
MNKYSTIFEQRVGCIPNVVCSLKLKEKTKPIYVREREVPFALREKVEKELDELENDGIISKVNTSDWGSPLVIIPKPDGKVRLCVDYKVGVNPQLETAHYPIKRIDELLNQLRNSKYFCRLDLYKAYLHVLVDEESKQVQTISTHRGTYRMNRLSFGIKTAPSEFNRILDQILQGLEGTLSYFDDIIIHGATVTECKERLINCFEKLQKYDLHVNKNKCEFFKTEIRYLGYVIRKNEILKSPDKVQAIKDMSRPKNSDEVRAFLGMITYYSKFIPDLSTITFPLRQLPQKNYKFKWSKSCELAFIKLKEEIMSNRVLTPYDPQLQTTLACDASPVGIAAVLSQIDEGVERPIAFISRSLTLSEQNYSQLDREALAIVFAIDKFYMYLYGREFILITDNKPLTRIFHQHSKIPAMTSSRLLRYASFLQGFNYKIQHKKAEEHLHVDCLSRNLSTDSFQKFKFFLDDEIKDLQDQIINQISTVLLTATSIAKETEKDSKLSKLKQDLLKGQIENPDYSLQDGVIFKGNRVVIPNTLQDEVLKELHRTHIGIMKMKQLARKYCYWNGIDSSIEKLVRSCEKCALCKNSPPQITTHHWGEPNANFDRVHIDYAGPLQGYNFFVLIDAKSKWPEIKVTNSAPTSEVTIKFLQDIVATHGLPKVIVSDNASIFQSNEFKAYCKENGIMQKFIAPGHPATNGLAERYIKTLKSKLNAMSEEEGSIHNKVREILYRYRATPLSNGKSPAQQYLGREMRIKLNCLRPVKYEKSSNEKVNSIRNLSVRDRVHSRFYSNGKPAWKFGVVKKKFGQLHYEIELDNGYVLKRHINQLYKSEVVLPEKENTIQEDQPKRSDPSIDEIQIQFEQVPVIPGSFEVRGQSGIETMNIPENRIHTDIEPSNIPVPNRRTNRNRRRPGYLQDYE